MVYKVLLKKQPYGGEHEQEEEKEWERFERKHPMGLWQRDWKMANLNGEEKWISFHRLTLLA